MKSTAVLSISDSQVLKPVSQLLWESLRSLSTETKRWGSVLDLTVRPCYDDDDDEREREL